MQPEVYRIIEELKKDENFRNIKDIERFSEKIERAYYNHLDIVSEIRKAGLWIMVNPERKKKRYDRFLVNWLSRSVPR